MSFPSPSYASDIGIQAQNLLITPGIKFKVEMGVGIPDTVNSPNMPSQCSSPLCMLPLP